MAQENLGKLNIHIAKINKNERSIIMQKQFKRTQIEIPENYKTLKAPQAVIVLKAIDELQTFDLKQLDDKCKELGLTTTSKRGIRMVADWYRRIFKDDGLVIEIKQDKPAKEKTKSDNKSQDTNQIKKSNKKIK